MTDALLFERDVAIPMRDGAFLGANVHRPSGFGQYPLSGGLTLTMRLTGSGGIHPQVILEPHA